MTHMATKNLVPDTDARTDVRSQAQALLAHLRKSFDAGVHRVAELCAVDGKLDAQRLDDNQWVCYELALASADLLAAETAVSAGTQQSDLDARLALAFAAEAIGSVIAKLETVFLESGLDAAPLHAIASGTDLASLRKATGAKVLADLGKAVADTSSEIGQVALDEQATMARDAFRRFAADVVAPMAEKIHRHDLTVPESLLQPMREMGVFGLSIPEEYGGSSPGGRENTPMMIAVTEALSEASLAAAGSLITRPEILARALMAGGTDAAEGAVAAEDRRRRAAVRDRHHRARLRLGRREPVAQGHAHRRRLAAQRREDVVHVRRQGRRADGGDAHQPRPARSAIAA